MLAEFVILPRRVVLDVLGVLAGCSSAEPVSCVHGERGEAAALELALSIALHNPPPDLALGCRMGERLDSDNDVAVAAV
jgi:hypothetical protein